MSAPSSPARDLRNRLAAERLANKFGFRDVSRELQTSPSGLPPPDQPPIDAPLKKGAVEYKTPTVTQIFRAMHRHYKIQTVAAAFVASLVGLAIIWSALIGGTPDWTVWAVYWAGCAGVLYRYRASNYSIGVILAVSLIPPLMQVAEHSGMLLGLTTYSIQGGIIRIILWPFMQGGWMGFLTAALVSGIMVLAEPQVIEVFKSLYNYAFVTSKTINVVKFPSTRQRWLARFFTYWIAATVAVYGLPYVGILLAIEFMKIGGMFGMVGFGVGFMLIATMLLTALKLIGPFIRAVLEITSVIPGSEGPARTVWVYTEDGGNRPVEQGAAPIKRPIEPLPPSTIGGTAREMTDDEGDAMGMTSDHLPTPQIPV